MRPGICAALILLCGCRSASGFPYALVDAVTATAVAVTASAASRNEGGCYATCVHGYVCNGITGFRDRLPCGDACEPWESRDDSGAVERCRPALGPSP